VSLPEEPEQFIVDLAGVSPGDSVRSAFDDHQLACFDGLVSPLTAVREGEDTVGVAVNHQGYSDARPTFTTYR
jgi:hypothetical protein